VSPKSEVFNKKKSILCLSLSLPVSLSLSCSLYFWSREREEQVVSETRKKGSKSFIPPWILFAIEVSGNLLNNHKNLYATS
jgi:hypothetical protein